MPKTTQVIKKTTPEEVLAEYKKKSEEILFQIYQVVTHTQRQLDDLLYRQTLAKMNKL